MISKQIMIILIAIRTHQIDMSLHGNNIISMINDIHTIKECLDKIWLS